MSERTGMCVSQVTDEVLHTGLIERCRSCLNLRSEWEVGAQDPPSIHKVVSLISKCRVLQESSSLRSGGSTNSHSQTPILAKSHILIEVTNLIDLINSRFSSF